MKIEGKDSSNVRKLFSTYCSWKFLQSLISGGISALSDLALLYVFHGFLSWSYWWSINIAYISAILINFCLQRFWTFEHKGIGEIHRQFLRFALVAVANIMANDIIIYVLVHLFPVGYLLAQAFSIMCLALLNFFLYRTYVFRSF